MDPRTRIALRAAHEIPDGAIVNLGVGIPTLVADVIGSSRKVFFHSENGVLGFGPPPPKGQEDEDLVDAGKRPITKIPGTSFFDSAQSFAMIRGGHIDISIMGTLQVDEEGSVANWAVPNRPQLGVGGAMDLLAGARHVIITTTLCTSDGEPKIRKRCTLPITAYRCAHTIITEYAVFRIRNGQMHLTELVPDMTVDALRARVEADFYVSPDLKPLIVEPIAALGPTEGA